MITKNRSESWQRMRQIMGGLLLAFFLVGLGLTFWTVGSGPSILSREDNPRLVEEALRIQRGQILSANNRVLAETIGSPDDLHREYPTPNIGPAVGYYSFRHGTSGVEEGLDEILRGESLNFWEIFFTRGILHEPQLGRNVRLTINVEMQRASEALLDGNKGALLLLTLPDGAVRALLSHPGYDPNLLDEQFEILTADEDAPLLNRVTQGQYQPGRILQPILLAYAVDNGLINLSEAVPGAGNPVVVDGVELNCLDPIQGELSWTEAFSAQCPEMMAELGRLLGVNGLERAFVDFGLTRAPNLPLEVQTAVEVVINNPELAAVGQESLTVSPLQAALALSLLGNGGQMLSPQLVQAVQTTSGEWQTEINPDPIEVVAPAVAKTVYDLLPVTDGMSEFNTLVLSGPDGTQNGWYFGFAPAANPRYLVLVVVEEVTGSSEAQRIGRSLLRTLLFPERS